MKILTLISAWARVGWGPACVRVDVCLCVRGGLPPLSRRVFDDEDGDDDAVCAPLTVCNASVSRQ